MPVTMELTVCVAWTVSQPEMLPGSAHRGGGRLQQSTFYPGSGFLPLPAGPPDNAVNPWPCLSLPGALRV